MDDLSKAYDNGANIPDADGFRARWPVSATAFRDRMLAEGRARLDLPYGQGDRCRYDLFLPSATSAGLAVFMHGGYWKSLDRTIWSHLAAGTVARGWACALPSYTLAPAARIAEITRETAAAITAASNEIGGPIIVACHSAGGHLSARMRCLDVSLDAGVEARLARIVPISPLSDLHPLMRTGMNAELGIDSREAESESPALATELRPVETRIWVGGSELPAFLEQSRLLARAWPDAKLTVEEGKHHFDVVESLEMADGALTEALLGGL